MKNLTRLDPRQRAIHPLDLHGTTRDDRRLDAVRELNRLRRMRAAHAVGAIRSALPLFIVVGTRVLAQARRQPAVREGEETGEGEGDHGTNHQALAIAPAEVGSRAMVTFGCLLLVLGADGLVHDTPNPAPSVAYRWVELTLETSARNVDRFGARPTILARAMSMVLTSAYDAWAAYDPKANGTRLGATLRRPAKERTQKNKELAIAQAAMRALLDLYPEDKDWILEQSKAAGADPAFTGTDPSTAFGVGNAAAEAVISWRHHDGANQLGDEPGSNGKPYSDYTYYRPQNRPDAIVDPTRWTPIPFKDAQGNIILPGFLTPHWYRVKPIAIERSDQFRPAPPPEWGSKALEADVKECVDVNGKLTLEQKAIVEFMRDGPRSTGQSGHWLRFAMDVSRRDRLSLDQDVKLFFSVAAIVHDAFLTSWDAKRFYDTSRPYWWVRQYYPDKKILGWAGPGKGVAMVASKDWLPYSPASFVTPPFPGYTSGHATASAAAARILTLFTGSDIFGAVAIRQAGALTEEAFTTAQMQASEGTAAAGLPESKEVRLLLPTFTATAEMAAISRLWGGYHIRTDNEAGLAVGRKVADYSWPKYEALFNGR